MTDTAALHAAPAPALRELGYTGAVRITSGPLAERIENAVDTYMALPVDDLLKGFRRAAGMSHPGNDLTGWARDLTHDTLGQWISGLVRLASSLERPELTARARELADGWAQTLPEDDDTGMTTYRWEKTLCGLVDLTIYGKDSLGLELAERITRSAARTLDRTRRTPVPSEFAGNDPDGTLEWYTLAENLYRGYLAGASEDMRVFAELWHYDSFWNSFLERPGEGERWDVPVLLHAYSHINSFASATAAYAATGDGRFLTAAINGHDWARETQCYATGGFGPGELTLPHDGSLGKALEWRSDTAEIVCGSWAAFKLCTALLTTTGEARFLDWAERLVYSGIGAVEPVTVDGMTPYYHDYRLGTATKLPFWEGWPCCSGTYIQAVAHLTDLVYFAADDGLSIGLYVPSEVTLDHGGAQVTVSQDTTFPSEGQSRITVNTSEPVEMTLRLRVPEWSSDMRVIVDGHPVGIECIPGTWAELTARWYGGEVVTVDLGLHVTALPVDAWHPHRVAFAYGPVVLAQDAAWSTPIAFATPVEMLDLDRVLKRGTAALRFEVAQPAWTHAPVRGLVPLADIPPRMPYRVYHDLDDPRVI